MPPPTGFAIALGRPNTDTRPDTAEHAGLCPTAFGDRADGLPGELHSSVDASTADTHFRWMRDCDIDTAALQRFVPERSNRCDPPLPGNFMYREDAISRDRGRHLRDPFSHPRERGIGTACVAMVDEVDEGTAVFQTAGTPRMRPVDRGVWFLGLEHGQSGERVASGFYLRLVRAGRQLIQGNRTPTASVPIPVREPTVVLNQEKRYRLSLRSLERYAPVAAESGGGGAAFTANRNAAGDRGTFKLGRADLASTTIGSGTTVWLRTSDGDNHVSVASDGPRLHAAGQPGVRVRAQQFEIRFLDD